MPVSEPSDLYGLPLERFVPERAALVKALRAAGRRDEAVQAAALRKPSVAAWAVNQLVRTQQAGVAAVFAAGDELQRVQSELLSGGGDPGALREASRREREAADELAAVARGLLSGDGHEPTQATVERVAETLHAAALDEQARARVRAGCLVRELRQVGFGGGGPAAEATPAARGTADAPSAAGAPGSDAAAAAPPGSDAAAAAQKEAAQAKQRAAQAKEAARAVAAARAEALRVARMAEADARRRADHAARQLRTAEERRDRAAEALSEAQDALVAAAQDATDTAREHERAQAELEALRRG